MTASLDPAVLTSALEAVLPAEALGPATPGYAVDAVLPSVIARPRSQAEIAAVFRTADSLAAAVVPFGGGTQQSVGMPPRRYDIALDLRRLDALIEHEPADLTVTVESGMRFSTLQRLLGERGQWLTLDPPLHDEATVGGVLATNASGPSRLSRGTARDLLIGITVATAQGDLVKSGGRVVKNVAGYDLGKLHIGGLGTPGVIVQASFKVAPLPPATAVLAIHGALDPLTHLAHEIIKARLSLACAVLTRSPSSAHWTLAVRFAAGQAAVDRSTGETAALAGADGLSAEAMPEADWRALQTPRLEAPIVARAGVLPTALAPTAEALAATGASVIALPGVGIAHAAWDNVEPATLQRLRDLCVGGSGALVIERAPTTIKQAIDVWGPPRPSIDLMQRLKQEMDPKHLLNPGRFVAGI